VNILTEYLPTKVEIDRVIYDINTDFRACLRVILAFEDPELTNGERQQIMLSNLFTKEQPTNLAGAVEEAIRFLNGGPNGQSEESEEKEDALRLYSFEKDSSFIFSAFTQTHGIDLQEIPYMHWWKFLALFMDLGQNTTFCQLVGLRKRVKTGKATKEEKDAAREMGTIFDVPEVDNRTVEEKEKELEFLRALSMAAPNTEYAGVT
jgi:hypothetical protein